MTIPSLEQFECKECGQPLSDHFGEDSRYAGCPELTKGDITAAFKRLKALSAGPASPVKGKTAAVSMRGGVRNPRVSYKLSGKISPKLFHSLNTTQQKIITRIRDKKTTTTKDLEGALKVRQAILGSELQKLRARGIIESHAIPAV